MNKNIFTCIVSLMLLVPSSFALGRDKRDFYISFISWYMGEVAPKGSLKGIGTLRWQIVSPLVWELIPSSLGPWAVANDHQRTHVSSQACDTFRAKGAKPYGFNADGYRACTHYVDSKLATNIQLGSLPPPQIIVDALQGLVRSFESSEKLDFQEAADVLGQALSFFESFISDSELVYDKLGIPPPLHNINPHKV